MLTLKQFVNIFICLLFFNPHYISQIHALDLVVDLLRIAVSLFFVANYIRQGRVRSIDYLVITLFLITFLSTIVYGDNYFTVIKEYVPIICILFYLEANRKKLSEVTKYEASCICVGKT